MKKVGLIVLVAMSLSVCGCQAIFDAISSPEDIVVDYVEHLSKIMNSNADCDKLAAALNEYCTSREAVVTQAVKDTVTRLNNKEISDSKLESIKKDLEKLGDTNMTSCLLTPSVAINKLSCMKPMLGAL